MIDSSLWSRLLQAVTGGSVEGWWTLVFPAVLVLAGWTLATLTRVAAQRVLRGPAARLEARLEQPEFARFGGLLASAPGIVGKLVFWVVLLLFVAAAVEALPFAVTDGLLAPVARFLPRFVLALAILVTGVLVARFAQNRILAAASDPRGERAQTLARLAWGGILAVTLIVSAQQVGLEGAGFVSSLVLLLLGAAVGAVALAFGIGAGPVVSNNRASHFAATAYRDGDVGR
ncbi:MAG: hypothetical protein F4198_00600 [Acidobacteria bacterium]|nr:hypothetical protein [Acidobacteriota bacterium]